MPQSNNNSTFGGNTFYASFTSGSTANIPSYSSVDIAREEAVSNILSGSTQADVNRITWSNHTRNSRVIELLGEHPVSTVYGHFQDRLRRAERASDIALATEAGEAVQSIRSIVYEYVDRFVIKPPVQPLQPSKPAKEVPMDKVLEDVNNVRVGITYMFSYGTFKRLYPDIKLIKSESELTNFDLIIVPGGEDISPSLYGQNNKFSEVNKDRDEQEVPIVQRALSIGKKMFGTCRGHQLISVLSGCSFTQDIFNDGFQSHESSHVLEALLPGSVAHRFFNKPVVSLHHQGVTRNTSGVRVTSQYKNIIESCESMRNNFITTQFHPEFQSGNEEFFNFLKYWAKGYEYYYYTSHPQVAKEG